MGGGGRDSSGLDRGSGQDDALTCCVGFLAKKPDDRPVPQEPDVVCAVRDRLQSLVTALASEWGGALPLVQVWLPKLPREASRCASSLLSVESAPFVLNDPSAAPLRRKSMESTFSKGHGLPGRVFATGAAEVIQDSSFVSAQHYSLRPAAHSGGVLTESLAVPIFVTAPELSPKRGTENDPIGVLEVIMASNQLVVAQELAGTSQEGRLRLVQGGAAAVIASICAALDSAGLSCSPPPSADEECVPVKVSECTDASWGGKGEAAPAETGATGAGQVDESRVSVDSGRRTPRHSASLSRISSRHVLPVSAAVGGP